VLQHGQLASLDLRPSSWREVRDAIGISGAPKGRGVHGQTAHIPGDELDLAGLDG